MRHNKTVCLSIQFSVNLRLLPNAISSCFIFSSQNYFFFYLSIVIRKTFISSSFSRSCSLSLIPCVYLVALNWRVVVVQWSRPGEKNWPATSYFVKKKDSCKYVLINALMCSFVGCFKQTRQSQTSLQRASR